MNLVPMARAQAADNNVIGKQIFSALVAEEVYVHYTYSSPSEVAGAGSFYLDSISCSHFLTLDTYNCSFLDTARPLERREIEGENAKQVYLGFEASGIKPTKEPFSAGTVLLVSASKLQCSKSGFKEDLVKHACQRLKPLVD